MTQTTVDVGIDYQPGTAPPDAILASFKQFVKARSNIHRPGDLPDVFLFSLPRSGSTWLMELISTQPGFKSCDEPTNLRNPRCRAQLAMSTWAELYRCEADARLEQYFRDLRNGRLSFMNPRPRRDYYRPFTNRLVFKVLTGFEDRIGWFHATLGGKAIYLLRHPIAVSLSREYFPTLELLLTGDYRRHFTRDQLRFAENVLRSGTKLEHGVLSWCLQNSVPLKEIPADGVILSYEQLVLDPEPIIARLAAQLTLSKPERMVKHLVVPSTVKRKSDDETQQILESGRSDERKRLVSKWREKVSEQEEQRTMDILKRFDLDHYCAGSVLPSEHVWIGATWRC